MTTKIQKRSDDWVILWQWKLKVEPRGPSFSYNMNAYNNLGACFGRLRGGGF